jgi:hypothetical protein
VAGTSQLSQPTPWKRSLSFKQWLFLIDGLFTLFVGLLFVFLVPGSSTDTAPICGLKRLDFFSAKERDILRDRIALDDPHKGVKLTAIGFARVLRILSTSFGIWAHSAINVISMAPKGGLGTYTPTIIKNLGFSTITASNLAAVSNFGV